jgi:hypothetical protein
MRDHSFIRDEHSQALINTDSKEIEARKLRKRHTEQMLAIQEELEQVKNDLLDIKHLLQSLISQRG